MCFTRNGGSWTLSTRRRLWWWLTLSRCSKGTNWTCSSFCLRSARLRNSYSSSLREVSNISEFLKVHSTCIFSKVGVSGYLAIFQSTSSGFLHSLEQWDKLILDGPGLPLLRGCEAGEVPAEPAARGQQRELQGLSPPWGDRVPHKERVGGH